MTQAPQQSRGCAVYHACEAERDTRIEQEWSDHHCVTGRSDHKPLTGRAMNGAYQCFGFDPV